MPRPSHKWCADEFIDALSKTHCVAAACKTIGIGVTTAYDRRSDPEFAARWDDAVKSSNELLVGSCMRDAIEGIPEPVIRQTKNGDWEVVGHIRKFDTGLRIFLMKTRMPDRFSERYLFHELLRKGGGDAKTLADDLERLAQQMRESIQPAPPEDPDDDGYA